MLKSRLFLLTVILVLAVLAFSGRTPAATPAVSLNGFSEQLLGYAQTGAAPAAAAAATAVPAGSGIDAESEAFQAIYATVNPSVVRIDTFASVNTRTSTAVVPQGEGSGFVWDKQGHIVTNDHVVRNSSRLEVTFADGTTLEATVVGTDPNGDLAVIKVDPALVNLVPVAQGKMSEIKVGQRAIAIGNPFGFDGTMTAGIVSAIGRSIPAVTGFAIPQAIQTDAAINPGNSGGPLLDIQGRVIGVNAQIQSSTDSNSGVGFAIPIGLVQRIVPALIQTGAYQHSYLGIEGGTYTRAWSAALGFPADVKGVYVLSTTRGGPADQAGLKTGNLATDVLMGMNASGGRSYLQRGGDLIVAVDGKPVSKMDDLLVYLEGSTSPGDTVELSLIRSEGRAGDRVREARGAARAELAGLVVCGEWESRDGRRQKLDRRVANHTGYYAGRNASSTTSDRRCGRQAM